MTAVEGAIRDVQRSSVHWLVVDNASAALCSAARVLSLDYEEWRWTLAQEVRGCGIESQVSWVTDAPPSREQVQRGPASGLTARPVHALQRRRYASDGRAGTVFVHPPL